MLFLDEPPVSEVLLDSAEMLLLAHWAAAAETLEESPATYRTVNDCGLCRVCKREKTGSKKDRRVELQPRSVSRSLGLVLQLMFQYETWLSFV